MKKLTWTELREVIDNHNKEHNVSKQYGDKEPLHCVAVIDNSSFAEEFSLESRSYEFRSDEKFFLPNMMGRSIFADSLDGTDTGVRLDWYIFEKDGWKIEYCYVKE